MGGLPYGLILVVAAWVLATRHARADHASARSKRAAGVAALASTLALPSWPLTAAVVQLGVGVYVIFHRIVTDELAGADGGGAGTHDSPGQ